MVKALDPDVLTEIVQQNLGLPHEEMMDAITEAVGNRFPKLYIRRKRRWCFSVAGGAMMQIAFIYGSLTEYLLFANSPIGTEGHSGMYLATDLWDWVLEGEMWRYALGKTDRTVYKTGELTLLPKGGEGDGFCIKDHCLLLEYARGFVPFMMPFGLADSFLSTLDYKSIRHQMWDYTKLSTRNMLKGRI